MEFEWNEAKRERVLAARGIDFVRAQVLFDGRPMLTVSSSRLGEERWVSVGELEGLFIAVVWTLRDDKIRIVTMRRARNEEKRRYQALYGC